MMCRRLLLVWIGLAGCATAADATLSVDAAQPLRVLPAAIHGVNLTTWNPTINDATTQALIASAGMKFLRFPGGSTSDQYDWSANTYLPNNAGKSSTADFALLAEELGAQSVVTANYGSGTPQMAAAWVAYMNADPSSSLLI